MKDFLRLYDTVELRPLSPTAQNRLYFKDAEAGERPHLLVRIAATHAGRLTSNNAFYPPARMLAAIPTFTQPYYKPVLLNHDLEGDPLGRIVGARYVDLSSGLAKYNLKEHLKFSADFKDVRQILDALGNDLLNPEFPGLGYAEVLARITDPEAVERILDGRYHTVSVSFVTDQAICSICQANWVQDGKCEHSPGRMVDDKPCFIIVGAMRFDEVSFVNRPADNLAGVLEFQVMGKTNRVEVATRPPYEVACDAFVAGPEMLVNVADAKGINLFHFRPNFEEVLYLMSVTTMAPAAAPAVQELLDQLLPRAQDASLDISSFADKALVVETHTYLHADYDWRLGEGNGQSVPKDKLALHAKLHQVAMEGGFVESFVLGKMDETLKDFGVPMPEEQKDRDQTCGCPSSSDDRDAGKVQDQEPGELDIAALFDEEKCWEAINSELDAMAAELEDSDPEGAQALRDAKLTTEQRKKLKASVFCGPNRSFPVPDCAHVTAARRLIGRYKGPGSKEAILRCVERKAKALGCDKAKKDAESGRPAKDELLARRQELLAQVEAIEAELLERFDYTDAKPCQGCIAKEAEIAALKDAASIDTSQLEALEMDLQAAVEEALALRDQLARHLAQTIVDQRQLQARRAFTEEEKRALLAELSRRSLESLADTVKDQGQYLGQLLEFLSSGMVNQPAENQVADPTLAAPEAQQEDDADRALRARIMHQSNMIERVYGKAAAQAYLRDMVKIYPDLGISMKS